MWFVDWIWPAIIAPVDLWHSNNRMIDEAILWPIIRKQAPDLVAAQTAFAVHALNDPSWKRLGREAIFRFVDNLR
jgi:hypothetical protein